MQVFRAIPRRLVPALALVLAASAVPGSSAVTDAPPEGSAGIGDAYFPLDGNGGIDVLTYDVRDHYDFRKRRMTGVTTLKVKANEAAEPLQPGPPAPRHGAGRRDRVAFTKPHQHELQITPDS